MVQAESDDGISAYVRNNRQPSDNLAQEQQPNNTAARQQRHCKQIARNYLVVEMHDRFKGNIGKIGHGKEQECYRQIIFVKAGGVEQRTLLQQITEIEKRYSHHSGIEHTRHKNTHLLHSISHGKERKHKKRSYHLIPYIQRNKAKSNIAPEERKQKPYRPVEILHLGKNIQNAAGITHDKSGKQQVAEIENRVTANIEKEKRNKNLIRLSHKELHKATIILEEQPRKSKIERSTHKSKSGIINSNSRMPKHNKHYTHPFGKVYKINSYFSHNQKISRKDRVFTSLDKESIILLQKLCSFLVITPLCLRKKM